MKIAKAANHVALHGGGINAQSQQQQIQSGVEQLSAGGGVDYRRRLSQAATQLLRIAKPCASRAYADKTCLPNSSSPVPAPAFVRN